MLTAIERARAESAAYNVAARNCAEMTRPQIEEYWGRLSDILDAYDVLLRGEFDTPEDAAMAAHSRNCTEVQIDAVIETLELN